LTDKLDITDANVVELSAEETRELLSRIDTRYEHGVAANDENRRLHTDDLAFVYDSEQFGQWDPYVLSHRQGRPSYTFNRVLQPVNMVLGDQRQTRPSIKVRPASLNSTQDIADIFGGLWRCIEQESRAEAIYDESYKHSVAGGFGEMMLLPEYESPNAFDQVLRIKNVPNPLTVIRDPESTDPCGADANWCMVGERISKEKYDAEYPDTGGTSFNMSRDSLGWYSEDQVRVVRYFERMPITKKIAMLSDGRIIDYTPAQQEIEKNLAAAAAAEGMQYPKVVKIRTVKTFKVRYVKVDGTNILEGPIDYDWKRIPVVRMPGRYVNIEGKQKLQSLIRHSKDAQRAYNFQSSDALERSALVPKARYFVTPKMIIGFEDLWNNANTAPRIYMPYNIDAAAPNGGMPFREQPIDVPAGAMAMAEKAAQDIQATTGMFDPALGNADDMNRVSGKALVTHTRRSDLGTHEFIDNYGKAIQLLCEMALDMIPTVYDAARVLRIISPSGVDQYVAVNQQDGDGNVINDLKAGSYDCTVTLGPSYQTARQESLATLIDAAETIPAIGQVAPDLIAKAIDNPDSDELVKRLRMGLIKQGIIVPTPQDMKNMPPPAPPDPGQVALVKQAEAKAAKMAAEAHIEQSKAASGDLYIHDHVVEAAGKHLDNVKTAVEIGFNLQQAIKAAATAEQGAGAPLSPQIPASPFAQTIPGQ
jgi:hypothetical protein